MVMKNILTLLFGTKPKLESRMGHELFWQVFGKPSNPYSGYFMTALSSGVEEGARGAGPP